MHISEIGFCSGHSASGVFVDEFARTTVPGLYAAGDMASVPHNYMLGAFTNGSVAGERRRWTSPTSIDFAEFDAGRRRSASATACWRRPSARTASRRTRSSTRRAASSTTTCSRRRSRARCELGQQRFAEVREDLETAMMARNAHELMRALEAQLDPRLRRDGGARLAVTATESRWGLYHLRADYPGEGQRELVLPHAADASRTASMTSEKRAVEPYVVPIADDEKDALRQAAHPRLAPDHALERRSDHASRPLPDHRSRSSSTRPSASPTRAAPSASTSARSTCCASASMTGKAYMNYDECWYCMPCEADCPTGAVTVNIPYLLR